MKSSTFFISALCAVVGAGAATLVMPAVGDQAGSNAGSVSISSPTVTRGQTAGTRGLYPTFSSSGNVETGDSFLTVKKGSKVLAHNKPWVENLKPGTYTITTRVRHRYVAFHGQDVRVVFKGVALAAVINPGLHDGSGDPNQALRPVCKVTARDDVAGTFGASCALTFRRSDGYDIDEVNYTDQKLGTMTLTGTFLGDGKRAKQDGAPSSDLTIGAVGSALFGDGLVATRAFDATFYNKSAGKLHSTTKTQTVKVK